MGDLNELVERLGTPHTLDIRDIVQVRALLDLVAVERSEAATALTSLMAERDHVEALLRGRDTFIVDQGLWTAFVATLPLNPPRTALDTNKGDGV